MRNLVYSLFTIFLSSNLAIAQSNFSESFFAFHHNIQLFIPSVACAENDLQSGLAYKAYLGKLSIIRTYYTDINFNFNRNNENGKEQRKHVAGFGLYNDREGDFFSKVRIIGRYALHLPIQENVFFSAGGSLHLINYNFHTPTPSVSGSDFAWSGSVSTSLYSQTFKIGISVNEINSPNLTPITYEFQIPRFFTVYGEKDISLNTNTDLRGAGRYNWTSRQQSFGILQLGLVFSDVAGVSAFYYSGKGKGLIFDLNRIKVFQNFMDFSLSYLIPGSNVYPNAGQYELNILYLLNRK